MGGFLIVNHCCVKGEIKLIMNHLKFKLIYIRGRHQISSDSKLEGRNFIIIFESVVFPLWNVTFPLCYKTTYVPKFRISKIKTQPLPQKCILCDLYYSLVKAFQGPVLRIKEYLESKVLIFFFESRSVKKKK